MWSDSVVTEYFFLFKAIPILQNQRSLNTIYYLSLNAYRDYLEICICQYLGDRMGLNSYLNIITLYYCNVAYEYSLRRA